MNNTDTLRDAERDFLPPGFIRDKVFEFTIDGKTGRAEVDGFHPETGEAIEICLSETTEASPKPGQKRKLASDVLKLTLLKDLGLIVRGRVFVTSPELSRWFHETNTWIAAACRTYEIAVELKSIKNKRERKRVRRALVNTRKEMNGG